MTGRPPETGGPAPLGSRAGDFRIAAARSMARGDRFFLAVCRAARQIFCPEMPLANFSGLCGAPIPANVLTWQRQERSVTFKLNQLSLACPVKRAQPPWTVDDKALIP